MSLKSIYAGVHFQDAWLMEPHTTVDSQLSYYNSTNLRTSDTTVFWTGITSFGIQDNTNWTSNTFKTIYSHTGQGIVYGMIACSAGGAETTTFEVTVDGVLKTITVTNANTERASLQLATGTTGAEFTTASIWLEPGNSTTAQLDSSTLSTFQTIQNIIAPHKWYGMAGVPALRYNISCLIRMKHSATITNATATAFSGVLVRKGIAS